MRYIFPDSAHIYPVITRAITHRCGISPVLLSIYYRYARRRFQQVAGGIRGKLAMRLNVYRFRVPKKHRHTNAGGVNSDIGV